MSDRTVPQRLQLSRCKGFDLQASSLALNGLEAVSVARPGPWGNPFIIGPDGTAEECVKRYRGLMRGLFILSSNVSVADQKIANAYVAAHFSELSGKNLACWCALDKPCHADVLLELANQEDDA